jgi:hypothetical protein
MIHSKLAQNNLGEFGDDGGSTTTNTNDTIIATEKNMIVTNTASAVTKEEGK